MATKRKSAAKRKNVRGSRRVEVNGRTSPARPKRRLAAIAFTDIVGYSALSHQNEHAALRLLEEHRKIVRKILPHFDGTEVKTVGDGFLLEFGSALEAVECAVEIQRTFTAAGNTNPATVIRLRVGIHLCDIVESKGDLLGHGVNIASRIQEEAEPGSICVTQQIYDHVADRLDNAFIPMGVKLLKNISTPIPLYMILQEGAQKAVREASPEDLVTYRRFVTDPMAVQLSKLTKRSLDDLFTDLVGSDTLDEFSSHVFDKEEKRQTLESMVAQEVELRDFLNGVRSELGHEPFLCAENL